MTLILGEKWRNRRRNRSEDLFFFLEINMMLGEKSERRNQRSFFLENIIFWKFLPRAPEFKYLSLAIPSENIYCITIKYY